MATSNHAPASCRRMDSGVLLIFGCSRDNPNPSLWLSVQQFSHPRPLSTPASYLTLARRLWSQARKTAQHDESGTEPSAQHEQGDGKSPSPTMQFLTLGAMRFGNRGTDSSEPRTSAQSADPGFWNLDATSLANRAPRRHSSFLRLWEVLEKKWEKPLCKENGNTLAT